MNVCSPWRQKLNMDCQERKNDEKSTNYGSTVSFSTVPEERKEKRK
jgi:hypothetical protein